MTVTTDVSTDKTGGTATVSGRFTFKNLPSFDATEARKPFFAYVGVADLALEQVKDIPTELSQAGKRLSSYVAEVPAQVRALPEQVKVLRGEVEHRLVKAGEQAGEYYAQLAVRGERLVTSIRRQPSTEAAIAEGKEAVRKAEAAATAARTSAKAGEKAVEDASGKIG